MNDEIRPSRPLNVGYLVVGLVFLGIAGAWALRASGVVDTAQVQWLIPAVLVGAGVIGLVAFGARSVNRRGTTTYHEPAPGSDLHDPYDDPYDDHTEPTTRLEGDDR